MWYNCSIRINNGRGSADNTAAPSTPRKGLAFMASSDHTTQPTTEEWRDVPGFPDYQVSNIGRIGHWRRGKFNILRQHIDRDGYKRATLYANKRPKCFGVHSLVLLAFQGERPASHQINHVDADKSNNCLSNLEYCTSAENIVHSFQHGLRRNDGIHNPQAKLNDDTVREIKALLQAGILSRREIAQHVHVGEQQIGKIARGKAWKHVS